MKTIKTLIRKLIGNELYLFLRGLKNKWKQKFVLDIHMADHCNLNCAGCIHFSPLASENFCDMEQLEESMQKLSSVHEAFDHINLMGGEPLLNPNVAEAFRIVRQYFPDKLVKLVTNGLLLPKMPQSFFDACIKYGIMISVSIYPTTFDYEQMKRLLKEKGVKWRVQRESKDYWKYFYLNETRNGIWWNYYRCYHAKCIELVGSRLYVCATCAYIENVNRAFGCEFRHKKGDYLNVDRVDRWKFRWFAIRSKSICRYCDLDKWEETDWHISKREKSEWIR